MRDPVNYGFLVAYRAGQQTLEVLLVRRPYLTWPDCAPLDYPGEYMFPGGRYKSADYVRNRPPLLATAIRSFQEQVGYFGPLIGHSYLPQYEETVHDELRLCHFFAVRAPHFPKEKKTKRIGFPYAWMTPHDALKLIQSAEFAQTQAEAYQEIAQYRNFFMNDAFPSSDRLPPSAMVRILDHLSSNPKHYPIEMESEK